MKNSLSRCFSSSTGQESASAQVAELEEALREAEHQMRRSELLGKEAIGGTAACSVQKVEGKTSENRVVLKEVDRMIGRFNCS